MRDDVKLFRNCNLVINNRSHSNIGSYIASRNNSLIFYSLTAKPPFINYKIT